MIGVKSKSSSPKISDEDDFCYLKNTCYLTETSSSMWSVSRKSREMHQIAARPTRVYIILATSEPCPPHIHATRSNLKIPMLPQLRPPIIAKISASLSIITIAPFM